MSKGRWQVGMMWGEEDVWGLCRKPHGLCKKSPLHNRSGIAWIIRPCDLAGSSSGGEYGIVMLIKASRMKCLGYWQVIWLSLQWLGMIG